MVVLEYIYVEASRSLSNTPHSTEILSTSEEFDAETST